MGYQFENLLLKNRWYIQDCLHINSNDIVVDNPYFQRATKTIEGCQIDYLIQTKFGGLFVCEFKFTKRPLGKEIIKEMQERINKLHYPKGFSVWPVLVHFNGVLEEVMHAGFFSHLIDFGKLLASDISKHRTI